MGDTPGGGRLGGGKAKGGRRPNARSVGSRNMRRGATSRGRSDGRSMRGCLRRGWNAVAATALLISFVLAAPAGARKFRMSGTWLMREGAVFLPAQLAGSAGG